MNSGTIHIELQPKPRWHNYEPAGLAYIILFFTSIYLGSSLVFENYHVQFWVLTGILAFHNLVELLMVYRQGRKLFWLKPVVLGAIVLFFLQLGALTNFLYTDLNGRFYINYNNILKHEPEWLIKSMSLFILASIMYWIGYRISIGKTLSDFYSRAYSKFWNYRLSHTSLMMGLLAGWVVKLLLNYYGGIGQRIGLLNRELGYIHPVAARLKVFEDLSLSFMVVFLFLAIKYKKNYFYWTLFALGILFEVLFAFTTGARSTIIFIFIAVFFVDYYFRKRLRIWWMLGGVLVLYLSMTVMQGFKGYVLNPEREAVSVKNPITFIQNASEYLEHQDKGLKLTKKLKHDLYLNFVGRFNYVNEAAQVISYKDKKGLQEKDPDFITPLFTFPVFAVLPKFYLFGEETKDIGAWATQLMARNHRYSTAISSVAYLYAAGGTLAIVLVFFIFGILMKAVEGMLSHIHTAIAFLIYLAILKQLVLFDSVVYATFINLIRYGILLPPFLWLLLRKWR